jgi:hypothetical protein
MKRSPKSVPEISEEKILYLTSTIFIATSSYFLSLLTD